MEQLSSWGASFQNLETLTKEAMTQVYNKYSFQMKEDTKNLAINAYHDDVRKFFFKLNNIIKCS